jgi:hypothetical protein
MCHSGHARYITDEVTDGNVPGEVTDGNVTDEVTDANVTNRPRQLSRSAFIDDVREIMRENRGRELPGTCSPLIIGDLFYWQARPWKALAERYCERIMDATRLNLELILAHTTDQSTCENLRNNIISPAIEKGGKQLLHKLDEIIRPHDTKRRKHPITYKHCFMETIQKARQEHARKEHAERLDAYFNLGGIGGSYHIEGTRGFETDALLDALNQQTEVDMDRYACSEAIDCMEAYYKVCCCF